MNKSSSNIPKVQCDSTRSSTSTDNVDSSSSTASLPNTGRVNTTLSTSKEITPPNKIALVTGSYKIIHFHFSYSIYCSFSFSFFWLITNFRIGGNKGIGFQIVNKLLHHTSPMTVYLAARDDVKGNAAIAELKKLRVRLTN